MQLGTRAYHHSDPSHVFNYQSPLQADTGDTNRPESGLRLRHDLEPGPLVSAMVSQLLLSTLCQYAMSRHLKTQTYLHNAATLPYALIYLTHCTDGEL